MRGNPVSIDIKSARTQVKAVVRVELSGAPDMTADYSKWQINPDSLTVEYHYKQAQGDDGWTGHQWTTFDVRVTGRRILKPAADGSRRLGEQSGRRSWYTRNQLADMPEWVKRLVEEMRPSGQIEAAGEIS